MHLHEISPATPNSCRLVLISEDQRLKEYVLELTKDAKNTRMLSTLDELESLINTLVSTIPEEFAIELSQKASKLFFEKENNKCFYYKKKIDEKIREKFPNQLSDTIIPGRLRGDGTWWISNPIFLKKVGQRIYWTSTIEPEFEIYHYEHDDTYQNALSDFTLPPLPPTLGPLGTALASPKFPPLPPAKDIFGSMPSQKKVVDIKGKEKFEVHWSANLSQAQNLTVLKLEEIQYLGNNLTESDS